MATQRCIEETEAGAVLSAASLGRALPEGATLLLDTSALIAYFDKRERTSAVATAVVDGFIRSGRNRAIVSVVTITELLVRPLRLTDNALADSLVDFITQFPNLKLGDIDLAVAREAAVLRARSGLRPADALILATGVVRQCGHIVSNDRAWVAALSSPGSSAAAVLLDNHVPFPA